MGREIVSILVQYLVSKESYSLVYNLCLSFCFLWKGPVLYDICVKLGLKKSENMFESGMNIVRFLNSPGLQSIERILCQYWYKHISREWCTVQREESLLSFTLDDFKRMYMSKMKSTLKGAESECLNVRKAAVFYKYTYQIAFEASESYKDMMVKNGRKRENCSIQRLFYCAPSVDHCASFFMNWMSVQRMALKESKINSLSSLMECGVVNDKNHLRKWILDIDAPCKELFRKGMIQSTEGPTESEVEELNNRVLMLACGICHTLEKHSVLDRECHFTVLTRHSSSKMSWHVTLNALTFYDNWRHCINILDTEMIFKDSMLQDMFEFIDKCTKNNSRGQYMQVWNSSKVIPGTSGVPFTFYGLFKGQGCQKVVLRGDQDTVSLLQYCASSMMIHDPFCALFVKTFERPAINEVKKVAKRSVDDSSNANLQKKSEDLCSWALLPECVCWMREILMVEESEMCFIPAMRKASNICDSVLRLLSTGQCEILVHALIRKCRLCVRNLKFLDKWHEHHSHDNSIVMCIRQWSTEVRGQDFRMFVYCMSSKCQCIHKGWVEIKRCDYDKMQDIRKKKNI